MSVFVALLRAVNVGGTGKLPMTELRSMCEAAGFHNARTNIASGNVVFHSSLTPAAIKAALEARLRAYAGKPVGVCVRTAAEMARVLAENPFPEQPGNRVMAIFLDNPTKLSMLNGMTGQAPHEAIALGRREIYVHYGQGMGDTRLRIPAARDGTARNMNTVAALAKMGA